MKKNKNSFKQHKDLLNTGAVEGIIYSVANRDEYNLSRNLWTIDAGCQALFVEHGYLRTNTLLSWKQHPLFSGIVYFRFLFLTWQLWNSGSSWLVWRQSAQPKSQPHCPIYWTAHSNADVAFKATSLLTIGSGVLFLITKISISENPVYNIKWKQNTILLCFHLFLFF